MNDKAAQGMLSRSKYKYEYDTDTGKYHMKEGANPKAPDYSGQLEVDVGTGAPVLMRISGWVRKRNSDGIPFLSLSAEYDQNETRRLSAGKPTPSYASTEAVPSNANTPPIEDEALPF